MLLSALHEQLTSAAEDASQYAVFLASPDLDNTDNIDAYVIGIREVEIDYEMHAIRLIPASTTDAPTSSWPILLLSNLMERLPPAPLVQGDFEIFAELTLDRESSAQARSMTTSLHLGPTTEEAWFLVRPVSEYASDVLPA